jgi:hypothetical protein
MSYIRSTSNTEHIYIFESASGIELMKGEYEHVIIPHKIFINLIRKYILDQGCKEDYKYGGGSLKFHVDDGSCFYIANKACLWHLTYNNIIFTMPDVVLKYIVNDNPWDFCNKKEYEAYYRSHLFKHSPWNKKKA